jgi:hypothetical protein
MKTKTLLLYGLMLLACLLPGAQAVVNDACTYKQLPIFVGGADDEFVNCLVYDPRTDMIVFGGNTTSANFAPA